MNLIRELIGAIVVIGIGVCIGNIFAEWIRLDNEKRIWREKHDKRKKGL